MRERERAIQEVSVCIEIQAIKKKSNIAAPKVEMLQQLIIKLISK